MKNKINAFGFAHQMVLIVVLVVAGVSGAAIYVVNHRQSYRSSSATYGSSSQTQTSLQPAADSSSTAKPTSTSNTASSASSSHATPTTGGSSSTTHTSTSKATPISTLTSIITKLKNGTSDAKVTASIVELAGPISTAHGRPIVFTLNGKTYFAYSQTYAPDFSQSASQLASSMALINATVKNPSLISAHLDKLGNLVDANLVAVGYSTGGN